DVDPGALTFLMEKEGLDAKGISNLVNKLSGVKGVSGVSSDMRDIDAAIKAGNDRARLALEMYTHRIVKYIGAYAAVLNGVDIIVFTGGVGENQSGTRSDVCRSLGYLGVEINDEVNDKIRGAEAVISTEASKVKVVVVPTDEELMIALDTEEIVEKL
ncbi:MAG: acetate kinase, partial [Muribaculaceae bacterium]|nr:acetate kinase [Muribaculaceae bacterium]